jgi:hypothetical protein
MSTGYKIDDKERLPFVTFQIVDWVDVFTRQVYYTYWLILLCAKKLDKNQLEG